MPERLTDERVTEVALRYLRLYGGFVHAGRRREIDLRPLATELLALRSTLADKWDVECANCGLRFEVQHPDAPPRRPTWTRPIPDATGAPG